MNPPSSHLGASGNVRGAITMMAGMFGFVTNDVFAKLASETLPTGQVIFLRGLFTTAIILIIVLVTGALAHVNELRRPAVAWRTVGEVTATVLFLTALFHIPIANATAILQAVPIVMTAVAALFLREAVGWRRWLAVIVGFAGMLMIVQPGGAGFSSYSLFAVGAVLFITLRDVATRRLPLTLPAILVTFVTSVAVTASGFLLGTTESWVTPTPGLLALLGAAAISLTGGYFYLVEAMRHGEVSAVSPFRYTILIPAFIYGLAIWGDELNALAVAGALLVVLSGLFVFYREHRLRRVTASSVGGPP